MHAFVTGATGFAGGHLCKALAQAGHKITALVRNASKNAALRDLGVSPVVGDIRDKRSFARSLDNVDVVYHLAAAFREARLSEQDYTDINVGGTRNVVEAAAEAMVKRFVHCSTVGVHGDTGQSPADEQRPFSPPEDSYNRSKIEGELLARELFERLRVPGVVVRPSAGYGPGDLRYLKLFKSVKRGRFIMIGSGKTLYNLAYIDDLCEGIILSGERPEAPGHVFILGADRNTTLNEFVEAVARAVNGRLRNLRLPLQPVMIAGVVCEKICRPLRLEPPLHPRRVGFFSVNRAFDVSKAQHLLGYQSKVSLDEGLARTAAWYGERGLL